METTLNRAARRAEAKAIRNNKSYTRKKAIADEKYNQQKIAFIKQAKRNKNSDLYNK